MSRFLIVAECHIFNEVFPETRIHPVDKTEDPGIFAVMLFEETKPKEGRNTPGNPKF